MFKKIFTRNPAGAFTEPDPATRPDRDRDSPARVPLRPGLAAAALATVLAGAACRSLPALPPADLSEPGWNVSRGQAVWVPRSGAAAIAGDILLATQPGGDAFVQFTKGPMPVVVARCNTKTWRVSTAGGSRETGGYGPAPSPIVWFAAASAAARCDRPPAPPWIRSDRGATITLTSLDSGESLSLVLEP